MDNYSFRGPCCPHFDVVLPRRVLRIPDFSWQAALLGNAHDPKLVHMKYFFTRKLILVKESNAMCCLPGGFGTLDEGLEVLTLLQTGKHDMVPVVFLDPPGGDYWQNFQNFILKDLLGRGMLCPRTLRCTG